MSDNSVVEFQKSPLPLSERLIRESAYNKKMIWIIHSSIQTSQTWKIRDIRTPVLTDRDGFLYYKNWIECFSTEWFIDNVINGDIGIMRLRSILSDIVAKKIVREEKNKMKENKLKEKNEREELERNRIAEWRKKWGIEEEQKFLSDY